MRLLYDPYSVQNGRRLQLRATDAQISDVGNTGESLKTDRPVDSSTG